MTAKGRSLRAVREPNEELVRKPPHDLPTEAALVGAMIDRPEIVDAVLEVGLRAEHLYGLFHRRVCAALFQLHDDEDKVVDAVTVAAELRRRGQLRPEEEADFVSLTKAPALTSNAPARARDIVELAHRRALIAAGEAVVNLGYDTALELDESQRQALATVEAAVEAGETIAGASLVSADQVAPEHTRWAWDQRIPLGELSLIAGMEGLGKSMLACELVAQLTRGALRGDLYGEPSDIVYVTSEDHYSKTVVPRLMAARADMSRVYFWRVGKGIAGILSLPDDVATMRRLMGRKNCRGLVLDPMLANVPMRFDSHKEQHVRTALLPLVDLTHRLDAFGLGLFHLNKSDKPEALDRITSARAFSASVRSCLDVFVKYGPAYWTKGKWEWRGPGCPGGIVPRDMAQDKEAWDAAFKAGILFYRCRKGCKRWIVVSEERIKEACAAVEAGRSEFHV